MWKVGAGPDARKQLAAPVEEPARTGASQGLLDQLSDNRTWTVRCDTSCLHQIGVVTLGPETRQADERKNATHDLSPDRALAESPSEILGNAVSFRDLVRRARDRSRVGSAP
jgi:hypothetical protein